MRQVSLYTDIKDKQVQEWTLRQLPSVCTLYALRKECILNAHKILRIYGYIKFTLNPSICADTIR